MIKRDNLVIINQPTHALLTIVVMNDNYPLSESVHENLDRLSELSDIIFVFNKDNFMSSSAKIDMDTFSRLYNACGWVESDGNESKTLMKVLLYDKEIFEQHVCTYIARTIQFMPGLSVDEKDLMTIVGMDNTNPIIDIRRLRSDELFKIYKKSSIFDFNKRNKYHRFTVNTDSVKSSTIVLKPKTINKLLEVSSEYINSFKYDLFEDFLASLMKYLKLDNLNPNSLPYEILHANGEK